MYECTLWNPTELYLSCECVQARSALWQRGSDSHTEEWKGSVPGPDCPYDQENRQEDIGRLLISCFVCVKPFHCAGGIGGLKSGLRRVIIYFEVGILSHSLSETTLYSGKALLKNGSANKWQGKWTSQVVTSNLWYISANSWLNIGPCAAFLHLRFSFQMYYVKFSSWVFKKLFIVVLRLQLYHSPLSFYPSKPFHISFLAFFQIHVPFLSLSIYMCVCVCAYIYMVVTYI